MRYAIAALLAILATPAHAEQLLIDHAAYPELLSAVQNQEENVFFKVSERPRYVFDRIKVRGTSLSDFTEALEIMVTPRKRQEDSIAAWYSAYQRDQDKACASTWTVLASDERSITFTRTSSGCPETDGQTRIYRTMLGNRDVFTLNAIYRGEMPETSRDRWMAVLASARLGG